MVMSEIENMPAKWTHCVNVYNRMKEEAKPSEVEGTDKVMNVWTGFTTRAFAELGVPQPYYGDVLHILKEMGCIQQVRRGGRTSPSQWVVFDTQPSPDEYKKVRPQGPNTRRRAEVEHLEQQARDMRKALGNLDIPKAFADMQLAIEALEGRVGELEGIVGQAK